MRGLRAFEGEETEDVLCPFVGRLDLVVDCCLGEAFNAEDQASGEY